MEKVFVKKYKNCLNQHYLMYCDDKDNVIAELDYPTTERRKTKLYSRQIEDCYIEFSSFTKGKLACEALCKDLYGPKIQIIYKTDIFSFEHSFEWL